MTKNNSYPTTVDLKQQALLHALVQFGGGVSQIRGSIDGTVFSRNRAGAIARGRTKPINPGTQRQSDVRALFGASATAWGALNASQISDWDAYAAGLTRINALGETYTPKGRQIFMEISQNLQQAGLPLITKPSSFSDTPNLSELGAVTAEQTAGSLTTLQIPTATVSIPSSAAGVLIFEASPPHDPKKTNVNNMFRQIHVESAGTAPFDLAAGYTAVFGPSATDFQLIDLRVRVVDNESGLGSAWLLAQGTVAPS